MRLPPSAKVVPEPTNIIPLARSIPELPVKLLSPLSVLVPLPEVRIMHAAGWFVALIVWFPPAVYSIVVPDEYELAPVVMTVAPSPAALLAVVERIPDPSSEMAPAPPTVNEPQSSRPVTVNVWLEANETF